MQSMINFSLPVWLSLSIEHSQHPKSHPQTPNPDIIPFSSLSLLLPLHFPQTAWPNITDSMFVSFTLYYTFSIRKMCIQIIFNTFKFPVIIRLCLLYIYWPIITETWYTIHQNTIKTVTFDYNVYHTKINFSILIITLWL